MSSIPQERTPIFSSVEIMLEIMALWISTTPGKGLLGQSGGLEGLAARDAVDRKASLIAVGRPNNTGALS